MPDCLYYSAIILSTTVQDSDGDGLLDIWETTSGLTDPDGQPLPDLAAMGARRTQRICSSRSARWQRPRDQPTERAPRRKWTPSGTITCQHRRS